jgi:hypothetical protein
MIKPEGLAYPRMAILCTIRTACPIGELIVDALSGDVKTHTTLDEMKDRALKLYEQHREQIEAPLL